MKRVLSWAPAALCLLCAFVPVCSRVAAAAGCDFVLRSGEGFLAAVTALMLLTALALWRVKPPFGRGAALCAALLPCLTVAGGFRLLAMGEAPAVVLPLLAVQAVCAALILVRGVRTGGGRALSAVPACLLALLLLGGMGLYAPFSPLLPEHTVVREIPSPQGRFLAQVVDDSQGALGGSTIVQVREPGRDVDLLVGRLEKRPVQLYRGEWGRAEALALRWEGEGALWIDGVAYAVG